MLELVVDVIAMLFLGIQVWIAAGLHEEDLVSYLLSSAFLGAILSIAL